MRKRRTADEVARLLRDANGDLAKLDPSHDPGRRTDQPGDFRAGEPRRRIATTRRMRGFARSNGRESRPGGSHDPPERSGQRLELTEELLEPAEVERLRPVRQ